MTHKKALKILMSTGLDRNAANLKLVIARYSSETNAHIVDRIINKKTAQQLAAEIPRPKKGGT